MLALREVSLTVGERSMVGIVGESGAGKSTLAKVLAGLIEPDGGTICFKGEPLRYPRERALTTAIQIVFQDPGSSLNPALTQRRVLSELLRYHKLADADRLEERCRELLDLVHLPERVLDARPRELSGGERQRMAIARALAVEPEVLLADEAVSSLDVSIQAEILRLFVELRDRLGLAVVLISHDLAVVAATCEEVMIMRAGEIIESGEVSQVFSSPVHGYTRALMDAVLRLGDSSGPEPSQVN
jgi:ABC-type glutathione transport system ATPase component